MKDPTREVIRPIITEHSYDMMDEERLRSRSQKDANKVEIGQAIEEIFQRNGR